jgi:hypothetical protein
MGTDVREHKSALQCVRCEGRLLEKRIAVVWLSFFSQQPQKWVTAGAVTQA